MSETHILNIRIYEKPKKILNLKTKLEEILQGCNEYNIEIFENMSFFHYDSRKEVKSNLIGFLKENNLSGTLDWWDWQTDTSTFFLFNSSEKIELLMEFPSDTDEKVRDVTSLVEKTLIKKVEKGISIYEDYKILPEYSEEHSESSTTLVSNNSFSKDSDVMTDKEGWGE